MLTVILLACSISSPFVAATPITQVVFRPSYEMNLQPQDVPDLTQTQVENPATSPLLPEAIDQDQEAYISQTQNIYVESDAIMVPERTKRSPSDIVDQVVRKRRPKANIDNNEQNVSVGDSGALITINAFCSSNYNVGLILIMIRRNIVVVLIGCGSDVTQDYILHLGQLVDTHVTAPPQPSEVVASSNILTATSMANSVSITDTPKSVATKPPECTQFNLTPEECANVGDHNYNITQISCDVISTFEGANLCHQEAANLQIGFEFSNNAVNASPDLFSKSAINTYFITHSVAWGPNVTIVFTQDGFILTWYPEVDKVNENNSLIAVAKAKVLDQYTISK